MVVPWLAVSVEGERAVRQINRLNVLVRRTRWALGGPSATGPLRRLQEDLNDAAIVRGWSIVEAYLRDRGEVLTRRDAGVPDPPAGLVGFMFGRTRLGLSRNFAEIEALWNEGLGSPLPKIKAWRMLSDYRYLRNLLVHALGRVTVPYKFGSKAFRTEVDKRVAAVRLASGGTYERLPVWDSDFDTLASLSKTFVLSLEMARR